MTCLGWILTDLTNEPANENLSEYLLERTSAIISKVSPVTIELKDLWRAYSYITEREINYYYYY